jgi:hypothetical protein
VIYKYSITNAVMENLKLILGYAELFMWKVGWGLQCWLSLVPGLTV